MRTKKIVLSLAVSYFAVTVAARQGDFEAAKQERIAALKQSLTKNQAALRQYTWTETTQISLNGEVKKQEEKQCRYGADGKVQKTPIGGGSESQEEQASGRGRRGGRLKKQIIEKKTGEMKDYMERVGALVREYVPPDPEKIQAAAAAGNIAVTRGQPVTTIRINNYLKQGDSVTLGFDIRKRKLATYNVNSYLDSPTDDPVTLAATFAQLPDGTNHVQQSVLNATAKKIQVRTTNSNYRKL